MPEGLFSGGGHEARKAEMLLVRSGASPPPDVNLLIQQ